MSDSPLADALAALNDKPLPDMLAMYGFTNVLCQPTTAEESFSAALLWAVHERNTGIHTLH
ncbi:hypothetical protein E8F11_22880 [Pseudomonas sp. BN417]|uniref:hypothetical protein n=1 Tax=Pseudomonas sp. BN417 TaxID=2567890 RepID=UPI0024574B26|nr:hypothetical protein [Pseudomonas sp. BN417]MDH4557984.1 hypothetical protein [Pseudomonas sp. BN417]